MRMHAVPGGIFRQTVYFNKTEIDRMCEDALREAKLLPSVPEPIRIERFIEKQFSCRLVYEDVAAGVLGCTAFERDGRIVLVAVSPALDDGTDAGRRRSRSTAAHEAGHCLIHPILFIDNTGQLRLPHQVHENLDFRERRILCKVQDMNVTRNRGYDGRWWEYQANRAIGGFLLPKKLVSAAISPFLEKVGKLGIQVLGLNARRDAEIHLAGVFDVNPVVAKYRLAEMYPVEDQQSL